MKVFSMLTLALNKAGTKEPGRFYVVLCSELTEIKGQ